MATNTYTPIASITLGSSASSVTFSSIPQDYRDLVLVINASTVSSGVTLDITFNNDSGANYSQVDMLGRSNGTFSTVNSGVTFFRFLDNTYGTEPLQSILQIQDYSATDKHKTVLVRSGSNDTSLSSSLVRANAGRYASTSALTTIKIEEAFGPVDWATGSTFALYGIEA